jgi:hypothetical protein
MNLVPLGRAGRCAAASSVASVSVDTNAPCVLASHSSIAPQRRRHIAKVAQADDPSRTGPSGWRPDALPSELRPRETPGWTRTSNLCRRRAALDPSSRGRKKQEPPAGVEPAPRPYKGRVLAVDTTEAGLTGNGAGGTRTLVLPALTLAGFTGEHPTTSSPPRVHSRRTRAAAPQWRRRESNPRPARCKREVPSRAHPREKCGRVESNHHSLRRRGYSALGSPVPGIRTKKGDRPDSNRRCGIHSPGC